MFTVNKDASGALRARLLEVLKRVSYAKFEIGIDSKFEGEPEDKVEQHEVNASPTDNFNSDPAETEDAPEVPPPGPMERMEASAAGLKGTVVDFARSAAGGEASDKDLEKLKDDQEKGEKVIDVATASGMVPEEQAEKLKQAGNAFSKMAS
jgi:hypothetical protein